MTEKEIREMIADLTEEEKKELLEWIRSTFHKKSD